MKHDGKDNESMNLAMHKINSFRDMAEIRIVIDEVGECEKAAEQIDDIYLLTCIITFIDLCLLRVFHGLCR